MLFCIFSKFQSSGSAVGQKSQKWPEMIKNYVCASTPYLSKHTSYDHVFCCTSLKCWHLQMHFLFFENFVFQVVRGRGLKGQKMAQNNKKICLTSYLRNCTSYYCGFWYTYVKWYVNFFTFSKVWFFGFFKIHQQMPKENSEVCPTFLTYVWFFLLGK